MKSPKRNWDTTARSPSNVDIPNLRRGGGGIPHRIVGILCLLSFGVGYTYGVTSDYLGPHMDSHIFNNDVHGPETAAVASRLCAPGSGASTHGSTNTIGKHAALFQEIAEELVSNTIGVEMLDSRYHNKKTKISTKEMKKTFYRALAGVLGCESKALSGTKAQLNPALQAESGEVVIDPAARQQDFLAIGKTYKTVKVGGSDALSKCIADQTQSGCRGQGSKNLKCLPFGHFYETLYQNQLGHLSLPHVKPFMGLEIGFFRGAGFQTYDKFLPMAEMHAIEMSCLPHGKGEGFWPWTNEAATDKLMYDRLMSKNRMHCGDAKNIKFLSKAYTEMTNRTNAPPLKLVVDDVTHNSDDMVKSLFFWFPRIEPGGFLIFEGIEPNKQSNLFRTQVVPQMVVDLHYCGDPKFSDGGPCFPTIQPLLASVHCEMHICSFQRNDEPARPDISIQESTPPLNALDSSKCPSMTTVM